MNEPVNANRPKIVCLIGSTRYRHEYETAFYDEEHDGNICLTVPCFKDDPCCKRIEEQDRLDLLHRAKIDLADEIVLIAPKGHIGSSTAKEIEYATSKNKPIRTFRC
jgi:hypothetical protein